MSGNNREKFNRNKIIKVPNFRYLKHNVSAKDYQSDTLYLRGGDDNGYKKH